MEPLYCIRSKYTEKEYVRFNRYLASRNKSIWVVIALFGLFGIEFLVMNIHKEGQVAIGAVLVLGALFMAWNLTLGADRKARKYYASDKYIQGLEFELKFYDDHIEQVGSNSFGIIDYDKIYKIFVTKNSVYIMRSSVAGIFFPLADCPQGFVDFIENIKGKYNL
ncbi:MAG: YcxB family protein [Bacteroidales bacterium]|nr:YcxB family protein [Bacteroidales bacterium]